MNWEYWPSSFFYLPNLPYAFYLATKAKHPAFFSVANPSIKSSGNGTESKFETLNLIPTNYKPKTILHKSTDGILDTLKQLVEEKIEYPLIAKPDIGFRGLLVKKIENEFELKSYIQKYDINIIIQEYINYKNECGIFYHRHPNEEKGAITSITLKKFLNITGDGSSTLLSLILKNQRASLYLDILKNKAHLNLNRVLDKNEELVLSVIGNHSKGTQFVNGNHLITKQLEATFDDLSKSIKGWFYGRIDLKYNDFSEVENGENFKILEINGIISEPTHIYDAQNSTYFKALKSIRNHWKYLYNISMINHQENKIPYKSSREFINEIVELRTYTKKVKSYSDL
ncbi:D-alanine--D-alanine ligase [Polaribacter sp. P097]|uniref:D-alanine--D-alanine ligase n=1 Tax=Polaribacter sp. P097 TaxID=3117398 RepID=UPI002FDF17A5